MKIKLLQNMSTSNNKVTKLEMDENGIQYNNVHPNKKYRILYFY